MPKGFNLQCAAGMTAHVWLQPKGGKLLPGQALVLLPIAEGETDDPLIVRPCAKPSSMTMPGT